MKQLRRLIILMSIITFLGCSKDDNEGVTPSTNYIKPNDFLSANKYKTLVVEIDYIDGNKPTQTAIDNVTQFLSERLNKPNGIQVVLQSIPSPGINSYSVGDIKNLETVYRNHYPFINRLSAYVIFVNGGYVQDNQNAKVLGVAYGSTSLAIFQKSIKEFSGGIAEPSQTTLETAVIKHEFGHVLGLVNNGTALQSAHQDTNHGHHCDNTDCLMYYSAETSDIVANLVGGSIPELDNNCIADLRGNGGK